MLPAALLFISLAYVFIVAAAVTAPLHRGVSWGFVLLLAALPFLPASWWNAPVAARVFVAFGALLVFGRTLDLDGQRGYDAGRRLWHMLSPYDTRRIRRAPPRLLVDALLSAGLYAVLAVAGLYTASRIAPGLAGPPYYLARWLGGLVFLYGCLDAADRLLTFLHAACGFTVPAIQVTPILSRTLGEFWSERWNRAVSGWLREHVFARVVRTPGRRAAGRTWLSPRRRLLLGLAATFVVSGMIHGYLAMVGVPVFLAALATGFFFVHGCLVAAEHALRMSRRAPMATRAWTLGAMLVTAPMLVEPVMALLIG